MIPEPWRDTKYSAPGMSRRFSSASSTYGPVNNMRTWCMSSAFLCESVRVYTRVSCVVYACEVLQCVYVDKHRCECKMIMYVQNVHVCIARVPFMFIIELRSSHHKINFHHKILFTFNVTFYGTPSIGHSYFIRRLYKRNHV